MAVTLTAITSHWGGLGFKPVSARTQRCIFFSPFIFFPTLYNCLVTMGFLPQAIRVAFLGESQLRQSRATQSTVHAGCLVFPIIHRTLTRTTGSLTWAQMLMHSIAHGG